MIFCISVVSGIILFYLCFYLFEPSLFFLMFLDKSLWIFKIFLKNWLLVSLIFYIFILYFIYFCSILYYFFPSTKFFFNFLFICLFNWRLITLQYCSGFCHTLTWISHGFTCVTHPKPPSHLHPHPIPLGCPSAPALSALFHASNLGWWSVSHMVIYMFQCYSLNSSHPRLLPQSPKVCSLHLCLFCCLTCRAIITIFLNSMYMC